MNWLEKANECPVLKDLEVSELEKLLEEIHVQTRAFKKDDVVAVQGDEVKCLIILIEGSVRGEMTDFSGRTIRIEDVHAPRPLASAFVFGRENHYPVDVFANEDVKALFILKGELLKLLSLSPVIQKNYLDLISTKAQFLTRKIKFLSFKTIRGKIAHYILNLKPGADGSLKFPVTQQSMASLFGVARPSVARAIGEMEDEGIIRTRSKQVEILNHGALVDLMNE